MNLLKKFKTIEEQQAAIKRSAAYAVASVRLWC